MKKLTCTLALSVLLTGMCCACDSLDRPIGVDRLPEAARQTLASHFKDQPVAYASVDEELFGKEYTVVFSDGVKIDFSGSGQWEKIDAGRSAVPSSVVPAPIRESIAARFPGRHVSQIERDRRGYEVELDNGMDLKYDRNFRLVEVDD